MVVQTMKGIYTYSKIEKLKVGDQWVLIGETLDKATVNLCNYKDEEDIIDQYLWYIANEINRDVENGGNGNKVINLTRVDKTEVTDFCLIAYTKLGKPCVGIEPNYVGYDGEISILNRMIKRVEAQGCVVTNACTIIAGEDRLIIREHERTSIYGVDFILIRNGYDKRVMEYIQQHLKRHIPFRLEYRQKGSKIISTR